MFEINGRKVGEDYAPLVIAEIGINHEGSLEVAKQMVDSAKRAGVEVIKHQTHIISDEMSHHAKKVVPGNAKVSIYEIMERCALNEEEERELQRYVESQGLIFFSTPFSRAAADRLKGMNIPAYKIGSGECNNFPLLEHVSSFGKPIILSTGMNNMETIQTAAAIFRKHKVPFALMHCTSIYPTPYEKIRLGAITELRAAFPGVPIGLSDHSLSNYPCLGAVALGGSLLERHYTDHMNRPGPDIPVSMDEQACAELIRGSKAIWQCRGGNKGILPEEQVTIDFAYASVVSIQPIPKGGKLDMTNIWVKRPGTGEIKAVDFEKLLGKTATRDIDPDTHISWGDVA
jgi:N-acetylneuraminate synthase